VAHPELELIAQLRAFAGVKTGDRFEVHHGGATVRVAYSGGSSSSLTLLVPYDTHARAAASPGGYRGGGPLAAIRPMRVKLTPESAANRAAKDAGIDAEYQSGDAAFDARVYVDTQTPPEVLAAVLSADARAAILELFELEFNRVELDDVLRQVTATMVTFPSRVPPKPTSARIVDAFARLATAMPRLRELEGTHAQHPLARTNTALGVLAILNVIAGGPLYFLVTMHGRCEEDAGFAAGLACVTPGLIGVAVGVLVAAFVGGAALRYSRRFHGRSDSASHGATFAGFATLLALMLTATAVSIVASWVL
jgi:hypothetical protein